MTGDLDSLADRLDTIAEELADRALDVLREAAADTDGPGTRPEMERRLTRARRSVEKASHLLRGADGVDGG
jgi:hypothetical protein